VGLEYPASHRESGMHASCDLNDSGIDYHHKVCFRRLLEEGNASGSYNSYTIFLRLGAVKVNVWRSRVLTIADEIVGVTILAVVNTPSR
jgi:hypothetical protein